MAAVTSDAGVLLLAEIERRLAIAERLARCLTDPRSPERGTTPGAPALARAFALVASFRLAEG
jgi:hypothetical protein